LLRNPHCLAKRLTDDGKFETPPPALYSPETLLFLCFWLSFLLEAE
jgi:hypothetical protein